jgi:hypothetical protein
MPLKLNYIPVSDKAPPEPPEIGRAPVATYSLHKGPTTPPPNFATLAINPREVVVIVTESPQGDPLPILFI